MEMMSYPLPLPGNLSPSSALSPSVQSVKEMMMSYPLSPPNLSSSAAWSSAAHLTICQTWQTNQVDLFQGLAVEMMYFPVLAGNLSS